MKRPEDIDDALVEKVMAAAYAADPHRYPPPSSVDAQQGVRAGLAAVWDDIYGLGYTDGFSDKEMSEQDAEMVEKHGWSPHFLFWFEGATPDEAEALIDTMIEAGEGGKPEHVNMAGVGALTAGHRHTPKD